MTKLNAVTIKRMKGKEKIISLTAYDYTTARIVDECGVHLALVGDSLGMTMLGYKSTIPVTMDEMVHHVKSVVRGINKAVVVADMPFMSYQVSIELALINAARLLQEAGADAVKIEGGKSRFNLVKAFVDNGIPVLGHIGLTPQSINTLGSYKVQGRVKDDAQMIIEDARALEEAGAFAIVLECIPATLGEDITRSIGIPTLGIGAGPHCDGQMMVSHDMFGLFSDFVPKFVKRYAELGDGMRNAVKSYAAEVRSGAFPSDEHSY